MALVIPFRRFNKRIFAVGMDWAVRYKPPNPPQPTVITLKVPNMRPSSSAHHSYYAYQPT
ncbi:hypothetical protein PspLS_05987 [Pyricularia sp. CBS 133598]|nr:hypothetical protein PspLS_05987 [Pyricularia sp. CBS 133598]